MTAADCPTPTEGCGCEPPWGGAEDVQPEDLKWGDMFGIDPNFCDGKPVDEWLDEQRGEA